MNPYYNSEADLLESLNLTLRLYGNDTEENKELIVDLAREFHNFDLNKIYILSSESFLVDRVRDWHQVYDKFSLEKIRESPSVSRLAALSVRELLVSSSNVVK